MVSLSFVRQTVLWVMITIMLVQPPLAALAQTELAQLVEPTSVSVQVQDTAPVASEDTALAPEPTPISEPESEMPPEPTIDSTLDISEPVPSVSKETLDITTQEQTPTVAPQEIAPVSETELSTTTPEEVQPSLPLEDVSNVTTTVHPSAYQFLMRTTNQLAKGEVVDVNSASLPTDKFGTADALRAFIVSEKERLDAFDIPSKNKRKYLHLLRQQAQRLVPEEQGWFKKLTGAVGDFFGSDGEFGFDGLKIEEVQELPEAQIPENPARFEMVDDDVPVISLRDTHVRVSSAQTISAELRSLVQVQTAEATDANEPVIEDITPDSHTALTPEIVTLATELQFDPVLITNYVRNTITYAPYYGAKKGAAGCLREQVCNDVDTASLTIALLRASGIPAQYKKEIAVMSIEQLKNFLGVDETRTVFAAFGLNKVPIYPIIDHPEGETLETADFTADTHFALEWVHPQVYLVYDEQMGIVPAGLPLFPDTVTTTEAVRSALLSHPQARDLQWVPVDVVFQSSARNRNTIAHDSATFDTRDFWNRFLQYSGTLSPVEKYRQELQSATGIDINSVSSSVRETDAIFDTMPPVLPYLTGSGVTGSGVPITVETFSMLPERYDYNVTVSLKHKDGGEVVFAHTFTGIEINNTPFEVRYEGATEGDQAVIESYGGLHATPATLVSIVPNFVGGSFTYTGETELSIGDELVLGFEYSRDGTSLYTNEKFSIAGNTEGVFITLHGLSTTEAVDDLSNPDRASEILLLGNAAIAREYLRVAFAEADRVADGLDYVYGNVFARAVVTQNRTLSRVEGTPTTFDFSGLSLDASTLITDYSRRSDFRTHRQDFRLLFGLSSSYYEGQFFTDLTSLTGISTVQGLQYAYANPGTYTVHTITSSNESVIDSLALSNNTKANMHADVAAGNTIITPDKYVEQGAFRGILYISLDPEGTGSYAIGEQVQNGGFTSDVLIASLSFDGLFNRTIFQKITPQTTFTAAGNEVDTVLCRMSTTETNNVINNVGISASAPQYERWKTEYGGPCLKQTKTYGTETHTFILAVNGAKFYRPGEYNYWVKRDRAKTALDDQVSGRFDATKFKFNPIAGVYSYNPGSFAVYYQPLQPSGSGATWTERGVGRYVDGKVLEKLGQTHYNAKTFLCVSGDQYCAKQNYVLNLLGYPTNNESAAAESDFGTNGEYQSFIGGQIYVETDWFNQAYYVPGRIEEEFNDAGGTSGDYGFPVADPIKASDGSIYQDFESGHRLRTSGSIEDKRTYVSVDRDYTSGEYRDELVEGFVDAFAENGLYLAIDLAGGVAIGTVIKHAKKVLIEKAGKKAAVRIGASFIPYVGWAFAGVTTITVVNQNAPLYSACNADPFTLIEEEKPAYYCGKLGAGVLLVGTGVVGGQFTGKQLNTRGVTTRAAKIGKKKLNTVLVNVDSATAQSAESALKSYTKERTRVAELFNDWSDSSIDTAVRNKTFFTRLFSDSTFFSFNKIMRDSQRYAHVFFGDGGGGWHYYPTGQNIFGNTRTILRTASNGVTEASVTLAGGITRTSGHTFFPDDWTEKEVLDAIKNAYQNKKFRSGNRYYSIVNEVEIEMFIDQTTGKVISAFPSLNNF
jgi:hypothetical protein